MNRFLTLAILLLMGISVNAQQNIEVNVSPKISRSISGHKELNRTKFFNLAANVNEIKKNLMGTDRERFDRYFKEYEMTLGRRLGMVNTENRWGGGAIKEDADRPGYMDIQHYIDSRQNLNDDGLEDLIAILGENQNLALHEAKDPYPDFMDLFADPDGHTYPNKPDAGAEIISTILKHGFTDFQRPAYYEIMNEPHWSLTDNEKFIQLHTMAYDNVQADGIPTKVGGPCSSVTYYYKKEYASLGSMTKFIDGTDNKLDFYSSHSYDYMRWDDDAYDFIGRISSGLPLEGVLDALAAYTHNTYGTQLKYVVSEHGGYISNSDNREAALEMLGQKYFPGSGFEYEMQKRTIDNFIMVNSAIANTLTYMNHPHMVEKAVPFILLETSGWDPKYYSSLLVKEDFDKNSSVFHEARLIDYYRYFADVKGRRVKTYCNDSDIQHYSFVDGSSLVMLFHNQSNESGTINLNIEDTGLAFKDALLRRLGRGEDFRPVFTEEAVNSFNSLSIGGQESIALFINYSSDIPEDEETNEEIFYGKETSVQFSGVRNFALEIPDYDRIDEGVLRIGISRDAANSKDVKIYLNDAPLSITVEDCAERNTVDYYATTKLIKVSGDMFTRNNTIRVEFPDGKSGGVGAIVLRAIMSDDVFVPDGPKYNKGVLKIYPNPAQSIVNVECEEEGDIEIIGMDGLVKNRVASAYGVTQVSIADLAKGNYIVRLISKQDAFTSILTIN